MRTRSDPRRGNPGRGAAEAYRHARRVVRRRRAEVVLWSVLAVGAAGAALGSAAGAGPGSSVGGAGGRPAAWERPALVILAIGAGLLAVVRRPQPDPDRWRRGAAGEVATAELLDRLGGRRWAVLHDRRLPGSRANVDHLVIGRRGVWVLDSKAFRAPVRPGWRGVSVGARRLDVSAVVWEAAVVSDLLGVEVRPLVVVHAPPGPGRALGRRGRRCDGVRVLPAGGLVRHVRRARAGPRLDRVAIAALAARASVLLPEM